MKKIVSLLFLPAIIGMAAAPDKSKYDLGGPSLAKSSSTAGIQLFQSQLLTAPVSEISLITGGYYTIGTCSGRSSSALDDDCGITFGHPYALTSYPLLAIDGIWKKAEEFFPDNALLPIRKGDTLLVQGTTADNIYYQFALISTLNGERITFTAKAGNLSAVTHTIGLGLVLDPALGRWGDGALFTGSSALTKETLSSMPPNSEEIWERGQSAKGLGALIEFNNPPDEQLAANWPWLIAHPEPGFSAADQDYLYDLALRWLWGEKTIAPNMSTSCTVNITLTLPEFSGRSFARWDLPSALSADQDILFPKQSTCTVDLANMSLSQQNTLQLELQLPEELTSTTVMAPVTLAPGGREYAQFTLNAAELYEDKTLPVTLLCRDHLGIADETTRYIHIPRVNFSDAGLAVLIDSVITEKYPKVSLVFSVEVEANKQKLLNLDRNNLFFSENGTRVDHFTLEKYTGGQATSTDIVFVLDCSGSMGDDIAAVKNNLGEFADSLKIRGYDYQIGVVTFSTTVDKVWDFTKDIDLIRNNLASIQLWGGVENSPAALYRASQFPFREGSQRTIIWLTDENYPEDIFTKVQIVDTLLAKGITVHGIGLVNLQSQWFNPIVLPTGGKFYNISGNFRDILLDISKLKAQDRYALTWQSTLANIESRTAKVEVHYAGLGGQQSITFAAAGVNEQLHHLSYWPNPFNPVIQIHISHLDGASGEINIYNLLGQRVRQFQVPASGESQRFDWDARNDYGQMMSSGAYFVELLLNDKKNLHRELARVLYLK